MMVCRIWGQVRDDSSVSDTGLGPKNKNKRKATSNKQQAPSAKPQAAEGGCDNMSH